jgi:hypothetical protein
VILSWRVTAGHGNKTSRFYTKLAVRKSASVSASLRGEKGNPRHRCRLRFTLKNSTPDCLGAG